MVDLFAVRQLAHCCAPILNYKAASSLFVKENDTTSPYCKPLPVAAIFYNPNG